MDPWHTLGVADGTFLSDDIKVHYIDDGSHCNDGFSPSAFSGSASLQSVRTQILLDIQHYLQGTPWDHLDSTSIAGASQAGVAAAAAQEDACGFDIVLKRTKPTVKYGDQIKVCRMSTQSTYANLYTVQVMDLNHNCNKTYSWPSAFAAVPLLGARTSSWASSTGILAFISSRQALTRP